MAISAVMVKMLRDKTGAGMLDCKSALEETNGNAEEAEKILRKKGLAAAAKKAGRVAADGLIGHVVSNGVAALVELNCETDFVAKTEKFKQALHALTNFVHGHAVLGDTADGDVAALAAAAPPSKMPHPGATIAESLQAFTGDLGEKTAVRRFARLVAGPGSALTIYAHPGDKTVVAIETKGMPEDLGKDLAMHVAALAPQFASRDAVAPKALADEREIARAKAIAAGKPEAVAEKMVEGMIGKWFGEVVLVDQAFAKDDSKKVSQVIAERGAKDASVVRFVRYKVGEGVEKKAGGDFAAEVAALTK
ncbi:MAG TPA: translation elongation factor Ts [Thermoanaerobaculia bacterium]|nr:translation elongation factor Ts [Thermoanaerobaculia bacterium]